VTGGKVERNNREMEVSGRQERDESLQETNALVLKTKLTVIKKNAHKLRK